MNYQEFLERKSQLDGGDGFAPIWEPDFLFDFQRALVEWALKRGRAAIFADCGLGKTPMQLVWAENVCRKTDGKVLILTPLAVSQQTIEEAHKFGIEAQQSREGAVHPRITVTNYERLHYFNPTDFAGVVCDESSRIKAFDAQGRKDITAFMRKLRYRLLCTATAAPNDFIELGTSSEALGQLGYMDMLTKFFKNDDKNTKYLSRWSPIRQGGNSSAAGARGKWRFKGHAENDFWRWVCSWARAMRKPSDLGFDDAKFKLPPLVEKFHIVEPRTLAPGFLFDLPAVGLSEEREEARRTLDERCERVAELVNHTGKPAVVWCWLNDEGKRLKNLIPDAVEVCGSDSDDHKEQSFIDFAHGNIRVLISKCKIAGFGLNWQHCSHMTFFPSHSYESYYQGTRRCWRFGQDNPVTVDIVATPGSELIQENLRRKAVQADAMFSNLVEHMNNALNIKRLAESNGKATVPKWIK